MSRSLGSKMWDQIPPEEQSVGLSLLPSDTGIKVARHWRSQSAPEDEVLSYTWEGWNQGRNIQCRPKERLTALKRDIAQLEMKLQDQLVVREALEQALGQSSTIISPTYGSHIPKQTEEMMREIAVLELEVARLEQYLLSLYRKVFERQLLGLPLTLNTQEDSEPAMIQASVLQQQLSGLRSKLKPTGNIVQRSHSSLSQGSSIGSLQLVSGIGSTEKQTCYVVQRSHSSLSRVSSTGSIIRHSPPLETSAEDDLLRSCHSQPLSSTQELGLDEVRVVRLADHLGSTIEEHVHESANRLSEDLVRCMAAIYCKLADPPLLHMGFSISPTSSLSSASTFSPQDQCEYWSPLCKTDGPCDVRLINPFQVKTPKESIGPYGSMVEVPWICVDNDRLSYAARMLHNFRALVRLLEKVEPRKMKYEEKLAFWINIYNALMMHAYLAYGIPRSNLKRVSLLLKAAYKVGGHSINGHIIENTILGCRSHRPAQWLRTLLSPGIKCKVGDERQAYALDHLEPLVCFALCCGGYSDPAVRVYTAENIYEELEVAKEEYLQASVGIRKENKVLLPKILEGFARESSLSSSELLDMICQYLPENQSNIIRRCSPTKAHKAIEWLPYNFTFRYIFTRELAKWSPPVPQ